MFKNKVLEFIEVFVNVLERIATANNCLQCEQEVYYGYLLTTLLTVGNKISQLEFKLLRYWSELLVAINELLK